MQAAAVAGTFKSVDDRVGFEFGEFAEGQADRLFHFAAKRETPGRGIEFAGLMHVIAHEEVRHGREPGIEILDGRFEVDKAVGTDDHAVFAGDSDGLLLREGPGQD